MRLLIQGFWYICVLRDGPQSLPQGKALLQWMIVLHLLFGTLYSLPDASLARSLHQELALLLFNLGFVWLLLMLSKRPQRFAQTATALLGADVLISGIGLLLYIVLIQGLGLQELSNTINILLMLWSIVVAAHVLRHAIDAPFAVGLLLTFLLLITSWTFLLVLQELMFA
ncbi:MAG: hypothetical protein OEX03_09225 [Gammaproteobacteria bacterium]|nr:hypothetical protein [Gammaproteobacteria bacterium]